MRIITKVTLGNIRKLRPKGATFSAFIYMKLGGYFTHESKYMIG